MPPITSRNEVAQHYHVKSQVLDADTGEPTETGGGSISATDGQIVFMDGTDAVGSPNLTWAEDGSGSGTLGLVSPANGNVSITGIGAGVQIILRGADGDATHVGGELTLETGSSGGLGGGQLNIKAGDDDGGGDGGSVVISSGAAESGASGDIDIRSGGAGNSAEGGNINIVAGTGLSDDGGSVLIQAGNKVIGGSHGSIQLYEGSGAHSVELNASGLNVMADVGFFGTAPISKPTGVAVTAEAIHAALVSLGLIAA